MFRGTKNLSTSELGTLATALGGSFNAATSDTITAYKFTVPAADLDAVLRVESDRMRDVLDAKSQWQNERGAIEQEVATRRIRRPGGDFFRDAQALAYAGTPYAHQGVGTKPAFDRLTGPQIKAFRRRWYAPDNAVLVIAGDVDPARTLAQVRRAASKRFPRARCPRTRPRASSRSSAPCCAGPRPWSYPLAIVGFRMPGLDSPDFLPSYVLQGILDSPRGPLRALVDAGDALDAQWVSLPYVPEAQFGVCDRRARTARRSRSDGHARLDAILSGIAAAWRAARAVRVDPPPARSQAKRRAATRSPRWPPTGRPRSRSTANRRSRASKS